MTPIFANSAIVAAPEAAILRHGRWRRLALCVRYGLIRHPQHGAVLIDTGYTPHSLSGPGRSPGLRLYGRLLSPRLIVAGQPEAFLARHGLALTDVRRVIVTHYHADHISGLGLFPRARFVASGAALARIRARSAWQNLRHGVFPELLPPDFTDRLDPVEDCTTVELPDLPPGRDLFGDGTMMAVDLPGHADGHFGLAFPKANRPLLYGVDTQWLGAALEPARSPVWPARLIAEAPAALAPSTAVLRRFRAAGGDVVLCHEPMIHPLDEAGSTP